MQTDDSEFVKKWAQTWNTTGALMEQFRAEDLQKLTDSDAVTQFIMLTDGPVLYDTPDDGLIEQQRLFKKSGCMQGLEVATPPASGAVAEEAM